MVWRPPRVSATARCKTWSLVARQRLTLMPYFFSKAADSGPDSGVCIEV
jgi:hypothetical protein